jgi:hypothetical protein
MVKTWKIKKHSHVTLAIGLLVYVGNVFCFTSSVIHSVAERDSLAKSFVGAETCKSCHNALFDSVAHTAHYFSSRPGSAQSIKGSFATGKNEFKLNALMEVVMERKGESFLQTGYINGQELQSESMDVAIGSGRKGQTYLYWKNNELFQLPVSYYTPLNRWCNSPGFPTGFIKFYRQIPGQCMECHTTYSEIESDNGRQTTFDRNEIFYGISCERCHGPGAEHVAYQKSHPGDDKGKFIINAGKMSRQQQLDACAFCHSGFRNLVKPVFTFSVGDKLDEYSSARYNSDSSFQLDVHGNQYGLLTASKCFKMSEMNCSSCHNVHNNEYNEPKIFSQRCLNCHNNNSHKECSFSPPAGLVLSDNCIDCHMPSLPSGKIQLEISAEKSMVPDYVRTHKIAIYPDNTRNFIKNRKQ